MGSCDRRRRSSGKERESLIRTYVQKNSLRLNISARFRHRDVFQATGLRWSTMRSQGAKILLLFFREKELQNALAVSHFSQQ